MPTRRDVLKLSATAVGGVAVGAGSFYIASVLQQPQRELGRLEDLDTLIIGVDQSGADFIDIKSDDLLGTYLPLINCYQGLLRFEYPEFRFTEPLVAESLTRQADRVTWIAKIRDGVKFHTGDPVTAQDVEYSWRRAFKVGKGHSAEGWLTTLRLTNPDNIKAVDDKTFQFKLEGPTAPALVKALTNTIALLIVNRKLIEANKKGDDEGSEWMQNNSAGSGPYILKRWQKDVEQVLERNPNYWGTPKPRIKKVILRHIPDPTSQVLLLQKGEIDVAMDPTPDQVVELSVKPGIRSSGHQAARITFVGMNLRFAPFKNVKVRQAVKWAIDYDAIVNQVLYGKQVKWQAASFQGLLGEDPSTPFSKDIAKAKALLSEAGYPNGFDSEFMVEDSVNPLLVAPKIQSDLAEAGIRLKIVKGLGAEFWSRFLKGDFQMLLVGWGGGLQHIENILSHWMNPEAGTAAVWAAWDDPVAKSLAKQAPVAPDDETAKEIYKKATQYMLENAPIAILFQNVMQFLMRTSVEGLVVPYSWVYTDFSRVYKQSVSGFR